MAGRASPGGPLTDFLLRRRPEPVDLPSRRQVGLGQGAHGP
jgi:hypothetical protein